MSHLWNYHTKGFWDYQQWSLAYLLFKKFNLNQRGRSPCHRLLTQTPLSFLPSWLQLQTKMSLRTLTTQTLYTKNWSFSDKRCASETFSRKMVINLIIIIESKTLKQSFGNFFSITNLSFPLQLELRQLPMQLAQHLRLVTSWASRVLKQPH